MQKFLTSSLLIGCLLLSSCATYTETTNAISDARRVGQVDVVAQEATKLAQKHIDDRDAVIFQLEAGSAVRALGLAKLPPKLVAANKDVAKDDKASQFQSLFSPSDGAYADAVRFFAVADDKIDGYEEKAKHSLSSGVTSAITNPAVTPYRGQAYDKVMCSTYQALNFLAINDPEKARASLNKAYKRQQDAVAENSKRIEKDAEKIEAAKSGKLTDENGKTATTGLNVEKTLNDPKSTEIIKDLNASLDARTVAYADYVNPFTTFLDGLFLMANSTDPQEQERAAKEFVRVASMVGDNPYLKDDALLAEEMAKGNKLPKLTYVIFESGEAPHKEEFLIPIPVFLVTNQMIYTQLPLSKLAYNDRFNASLTVTTAVGGVQTTSATATICNMDSVISKDFKNQVPTMWLDAFICAATKAVIQYEFNKQVDKNDSGYGGIFLKAAFAITNAATTRADTRSWRGLPKTFSYARLATPDSKTITVSTPDGQNLQVLLPDAQVAVVFVKQTQPSTPLLADSFALR